MMDRLLRVSVIVVALAMSLGCAQATPVVDDVRVEAAPTAMVEVTPSPAPGTPISTTPAAVPTAVADPTASPEPTQPAVAGGANGSTSALPVEPFRMQIFEHVDRGLLAEDGEYYPEYPEGAMTWSLKLDVDPQGGYAAWILDGVAEPGDGGCSEFLETRDGVFERSSFEPGSLDFVVSSEERILGSVIEDFPLAEKTIWEVLGVVPRIETDNTGGEYEVAELDERQTAVALEELPELGGIRTVYQTSRIETVRGENGDIVETRVVANHVGDTREYDEATATEVETFELTYRFEALPDDAERLTVDTPILRPGGCNPPTADIEGTWTLLSFLSGDEIPGRALEQVGGAFLTFGPDGAISGSSGCRTITGSGVIEFSSIEQVSIEVEGEPCVDGQFEETRFEDWFLATVGADMRVVVDLEDRLFLLPADSELEGLAIVFRRSG